MPEVKVYSTPTCVYCVTLKKFLEEKGVEFEEIDISENKEAADEMIERTGQMGVPVIEINGEMIVGFDRNKIEKALEIN